ncbi:PREDICTED: non-canonical poly(A) RNA polymerase PAPD5-like [Drosophila arizonae]|uniref:Non-canonical poly(A) RNA polymerase PAPD5-like n=1 Tax=Drosophila arizonae TaxID=7263 RepID=A0ABM1NP35_DROAR|nr:PREDICTED: non-canonical poly(A) RNA polymerase PAPD5-like [Drosophila arizonae]
MQTTRKYGGYPWRQSSYNYGDGIIGLHEEIEHFYRYILPTPTEHAARIELLSRVERVIQGLWPEALVEIFGSFRLGINLPNSDIDLVVLGRWEHLPLRSLESELRSSGIVLPGTLQVVDTAAVPIIRFTDCETHLKIDISVNMPNGIESSELVKKFLHEHPVLGKLVLVLKQFLEQRNLISTLNGGISSYNLIIMCINFLQMHPRQHYPESTNLGVLLLEFFELYGLSFNYAQIGISIWQGYVRKENVLVGSRTPSLYIDDPLLPGRQNSRSFIATCHIKQVFQWAYRVLSEALFAQVRECDSHHRAGFSILGSIIHITDERIDYRAWLRKKFHHLVVLEPKE